MYEALEAFLLFLGNVAKVQAMEQALEESGYNFKNKERATAAVFLIMDAFGKDVEWVAA